MQGRTCQIGCAWGWGTSAWPAWLSLLVGWCCPGRWCGRDGGPGCPLIPSCIISGPVSSFLQVPSPSVAQHLYQVHIMHVHLSIYTPPPQRSTQPWVKAAMCQDVMQQVSGSSLTGNMLMSQASVSGSGQRFSASPMRLWHSPCQCTPLGCNLVSRVSACWLTELGFRHT